MSGLSRGPFVLLVLSLSKFLMEVLKIGSLNINGASDREKRGVLNCTVDPHLDRRGEEPHVGSASVLGWILTEYDLVDTWRVQHPDKRGFTWMKAGPDRVCAARLDRIYVFK